MRRSLERGKQIAHTEWNWNGWDSEGLEEGRNYHIAMGAGVGAYLHGMIRDGGDLALANQSMTIGNGWNIPAIRVREDGDPFLGPQGQAIAHFRQYARGWRIAHKTRGMPSLSLPAFHPPHKDQTFALLDVVATRDAHGVAIHIVSRAYDDKQALRIDLSGFVNNTEGSADWFQLTPRSLDATLADNTEIFAQGWRSLQSINTIVVELR